jgi:hypothetical protein
MAIAERRSLVLSVWPVWKRFTAEGEYAAISSIRFFWPEH